LSQRLLNNQGAAVWTNTGQVFAYSGAVVTNGGHWEAQSDAIFSYDNVHAPMPVFHNGGTFVKTGGAGTTTFYKTTVRNHGAMIVEKGILRFDSSQYTQFSGRLTLAGGGLTSTPYEILVKGGILSGAGSITGAVNNSAEIDPGNSIGTLTVSGRWEQGGNLNIELGGLAPGQSDAVNAGGAATLDGTLSIGLAPGYRPSPGDSFEVCRFASHSGDFTRINGTDLGGGLHLVPRLTGTNLTLAATSGPISLRSMTLFPWERGQMYARCTAEPHRSYIVQGSTNLESWINLLTNATPSGVIEYLDPDAPAYPGRFYRLVEAP
jgi:hypothetical protein